MTISFASGLSTAADPERAVLEVLEQIAAVPSAGDAAYHIAVVFFSPHHGGDADSIAQTLIDRLGITHLIGASCDGVIGTRVEVEKGPALSVMVGRLPGVQVAAVHIGQEQWAGLVENADTFSEQFCSGGDCRGILAIGDPWTTPITPLLSAADRFAPGIPLIGGMASASRRAGGNVLLHNDARADDGLVALSLSGPLAVEPIVSQGCRPIGRPYLITRANDNIIEHLGGKPALVVLEEVVESLPDDERELLGYGLMLGRAMSEYRESFGRGDFVVRNIVGVHEQAQALAVGDTIRVGQTVQFHVRDALSAHEDLNRRLSERATSQPAGALCFSCNGRGSNLFTQPSHDAALIEQVIPGLPLAGCFAAGELGPVGGNNFIHGHTASIALFSAP